MTPTSLPADAGTLLTLRRRPLRSALRAVAIAACLPYLALKIAWIAGSRIGIPEGSVLLDHRALIAVVNSVTVLMDAAVVVLALLLTQPWGMRVRGRLLGVPIWGATGLLAPIMVGFPVQLAASAAGGTTTQDTTGEPFLDGWVFDVVYSGFLLQGLALGVLFLLYARDRWSHLWRGQVWDLPSAVTGRPVRALAVAGALLAVFPGVMHLMWAAGSTAALPAARVLERTTDFYVLEGVRVGFVALAVAGTLLLAFRLGPALSVKLPLGMAWVGASALGAWGGWLTMTAAMPPAHDAEQPTTLLTLTYAGEMISGLLLSAAVAVLLRRRGA
ncbi:hypothetical protein J7E88_15850 [Streptomyces sp. ISL-10]|uniref:hypothetical protein n=1 Tax=Streptomyces sp. ISL-10 TaxID=2819172 RepID=UPI001BEA06DD|nr:hypothetical protein [Streptomyces sp. ISL-10]MBT2366744.1 hypothetical protein [Streptomyces sp. ISL-10]